MHIDPILRPPFVTKYAGEAGRLIIAMAVPDPGTVEFARLTIDASSKFDPELYFKSRALGVAMEVIEDKILTIMETTADDNEWRIDCLIFDGGLLRKREGKTLADVLALVLVMEEEILRLTGVAMGLEVKTF